VLLVMHMLSPGAGGKPTQQQGHVLGQLLSSPKYIQEQQQQLQHQLETAQQQLLEQQQHQVYAWLAAGSDWLQLLLSSQETSSSMSSSAEGADTAGPPRVCPPTPGRAMTTTSSHADDSMQEVSNKDSASSAKQSPASSLALRMLGLSPSGGDSQQQVLVVRLTWAPEADMQTLTGEQRLAARKLLAAVLGVPLTSVLLKGVHSTPSGGLRLEADLVYTRQHQEQVTAFLSRCGGTPEAVVSSTSQPAALRLPQLSHTTEGVPAAAALVPDDAGLVDADDGEVACLRLQACSVAAVKAPMVHLGVANTTAGSSPAAGQSAQQVASESRWDGPSQQQLQKQQQQQQQQEQLAHGSKCLPAAHPPPTAQESDAATMTGEGQQSLVTSQAQAVVTAPEPQEVSLALSLPYAHYQLVTADGRPLERPHKHPFCFSRVMYSPQDCGVSEEVWVQLEGLGCR
jgi:hypothetical protein